MPRSAAHVDQPAMHFPTHPVAGVPIHVYGPAGHFASYVPAGIALDLNFSLGHPGPNPVYAREIAAELDPLVRRVSADLEKFLQRQLLVAVLNFKSFDLRQAHAAHSVGRESFDFDRDGGLAVVLKCECHRWILLS